MMISTDKNIFNSDSDVRRRMLDYGRLFEELHIIVFTERKDSLSQINIAKNITVYPTNSLRKIFCVWNGYGIAEKVMKSGGNWVVTTQDPFETGLLGFLLRKQFNAPLQFQVHTDFLSPYFYRESLKNRMRIFLAKKILKKADHIRVVSKRIAKSLEPLSIPEEKIKILPIAVDFEKIMKAPININLHEEYKEFDFIILIASRITREKNIGLALKVLPTVIKSHPKTMLLIVGDGPELKNLQLTTNNLKLENNVKFEPWTPDIISYQKTADLFLLTSNYEGYNLAVLEAMACGKPVIMTDVGLAGEILVDGESGIVTPVGDKQALTEGLIRLIQDKSKRDRLSQGARSAVKKLISRDDYFNQFKEILESIPVRKIQFCYVLPEFKENSVTHFSYLTDFLKAIAKKFDIYLIIEKGETPSRNLSSKKIDFIGSNFFIWRIAKTFFVFLKSRLAGCYDFYIHYSFLSAFCASLITKVFGGRVFYWNCGEPWKYKRGFCRDAFERATYRLIDYLVTGTEGLKKEYSRHYGISGQKIKVMPNWIDLKNFQFFLRPRAVRPSRAYRRGAQDRGAISNFQKDELREKLSIKPDQKIILFVHRLSKRKGAHYLPEIAKRLNALIHNSKFIILVIGEGPERENIEASIKNYGLSDRVRFLGAIPNYQLPSYYSLADIFIMPSDEEGFPHVLLESMALGTPFVASRVGGVEDIIPKEANIYLSNPGDTKTFVDKVLAVLNLKEDELEKLKALLREWVHRYDIDYVLKNFKNLIDNPSGYIQGP